MGTSSSGGGGGNRNPLIPSWISGGDAPAPAPPTPPPPPPEAPQDGKEKPDAKPEPKPDGKPEPKPNPPSPPAPQIPNRYTGPRKDFNKFVSSRGSNTGALRKALKGYSRHAAGSSTGMARRMSPAASRVASFVTAINTIRQAGVETALRQFNLSAYNNKPVLDILSALNDEIFKDTGRPFENTQDDSITKEAYANTVVRISEIEGIDLDNLTNENVEVMIATFIEESIAQRVITDIGNKMTKLETDPAKLVEMENSVYQMVNGFVRNQIMLEIIATQRGDKENLERKIENVYRIAFDVMSGENE